MLSPLLARWLCSYLDFLWILFFSLFHLRGCSTVFCSSNHITIALLLHSTSFLDFNSVSCFALRLAAHVSQGPWMAQRRMLLHRGRSATCEGRVIMISRPHVTTACTLHNTGSEQPCILQKRQKQGCHCSFHTAHMPCVPIHYAYACDLSRSVACRATVSRLRIDLSVHVRASTRSPRRGWSFWKEKWVSRRSTAAAVVSTFSQIRSTSPISPPCPPTLTQRRSRTWPSQCQPACSLMWTTLRQRCPGPRV